MYHGLGALFGAILGFLAALAPEVIQMLKDRFSHQRGLEAKQQELDAAAQGYEYTIQNQNDEMAQQAAQIDALQKQLQDQDDIKNHPHMELLRSSVRPLVTYGFFGLFAVIKLVTLHHALQCATCDVTQVLTAVWDEDSEALFAAVITFWFGSRMTNTVSPRSNDPDAASHPTAIKGSGGGIVSGE